MPVMTTARQRLGASVRTRRDLHVLFALAVLIAARPARVLAQDSVSNVSGDTLHLTLSDLLDSIQSSHPVVAQGSAMVLAAHQRRNAAGRLLDNPNLEWQHSGATSYLMILRQPIFWPWDVTARRHLGDAEVAVAHSESQLLTDSVALAAAQRFADVLRDRAQVALATEAESLASVVYDRSVAARQLGEVGDLTVLQARVALDAARRDRATAGDEHRVSMTNLALMIGVPPDAPIVPEGDLATLAAVSEPDSGYLALALGTDPELQRFTAAKIRADREASLWRSQGRIPQLTFGPSFGWSINSVATIPPVPPSTTPTYKNADIHYLGFDVELDIPIWHGHAAETEAANQDRAAAEAGHQARQRELQFEVLDATTTMSRASRQLQVLRTGDLARARLADSLAANALRAGGPYLTTWVSAREGYLDARRAELDLLWQAARARLILQYLTGTLLAPPEQQ